ncbi:unnamed protein product [Amaranthus hypochondriacus]
MKKSPQNLIVVFMLFGLLFVSCSTSARVLHLHQPPMPQDNLELKVNDSDSSVATNSEDISNLMGLEENEACGNKGEECNSERKLLAEAHLDYIYTQNLGSP